jgi:hypothetical protein
MKTKWTTKYVSGRGVNSKRNKNRQIGHKHRVRNGDGVFISPMGTTLTDRETCHLPYACKHCA